MLHQVGGRMRPFLAGPMTLTKIGPAMTKRKDSARCRKIPFMEQNYPGDLDYHTVNYSNSNRPK